MNNDLKIAQSISRLLDIMEKTNARIGKLEDSHLEIVQLVMKLKAIEADK